MNSEGLLGRLRDAAEEVADQQGVCVEALSLLREYSGEGDSDATVGEICEALRCAARLAPLGCVLSGWAESLCGCAARVPRVRERVLPYVVSLSARVDLPLSTRWKVLLLSAVLLFHVHKGEDRPLLVSKAVEALLDLHWRQEAQGDLDCSVQPREAAELPSLSIILAKLLLPSAERQTSLREVAVGVLVRARKWLVSQSWRERSMAALCSFLGEEDGWRLVAAGQLAKDQDSICRCAALESLVHLSTPAWITSCFTIETIFTEALWDPVPRVRWCAALSLKQYLDALKGPEFTSDQPEITLRARDGLLTMAAEEDTRLQTVAFQALFSFVLCLPRLPADEELGRFIDRVVSALSEHLRTLRPGSSFELVDSGIRSLCEVGRNFRPTDFGRHLADFLSLVAAFAAWNGHTDEYAYESIGELVSRFRDVMSPSQRALVISIVLPDALSTEADNADLCGCAVDTLATIAGRSHSGDAGLSFRHSVDLVRVASNILEREASSSDLAKDADHILQSVLADRTRTSAEVETLRQLISVPRHGVHSQSE